MNLLPLFQMSTNWVQPYSSFLQEVREEPEETKELEVREMRKTGFRGRELWEQKPRVSEESLEPGGGSIRQSRDFDLR